MPRSTVHGPRRAIHDLRWTEGQGVFGTNWLEAREPIGKAYQHGRVLCSLKVVHGSWGWCGWGG